MDKNIFLCCISLLILSVAVISTGYIWRKKLIMREMVIGVFVYIVCKMVIFRLVTNFLFQEIGIDFPNILQGTISALIDSILIVAAYFFVNRIFYSKNNNAGNAISVAYGAVLMEVIFSVGYSLLSFLLVFQRIADGSAVKMFSEMGYDAKTIASMSEYFSSISELSILLVLAKGLSIILVQLTVSLLVYQYKSQNNSINLIFALCIALLFSLIMQVIVLLNQFIALILFAVATSVFVIYLLHKTGNVISISWKEQME